jgi:hypothetical protein
MMLPALSSHNQLVFLLSPLGLLQVWINLVDKAVAALRYNRCVKEMASRTINVA